MTRPDAHDRYAELAVGHALSALEPDEEQEFVGHVAGCAACERAVDEHRATLAHLAHAAPAAEPPVAVLEAIRAGVLASGGSLRMDDATPDPVPAALDEVRARRERRRLPRAASLTGVAAAAALVVSLGAWNAVLQRDRDAQQEWGDRLAAAVGSLEDADAETVPLAADSGDVVAVAVMSGGAMSLVVDGLPVNDAATTYVLWGESAFGDKRAVAAFDVTVDGVDVLSGMALPDGVSDVRTLLVTREQGDGAPPIPTLPVLASGTV